MRRRRGRCGCNQEKGGGGGVRCNRKEVGWKMRGSKRRRTRRGGGGGRRRGGGGKRRGEGGWVDEGR